MAEFDIVMKYKPGSAMIKLDALSRKTGNAKEGLESQFFPDGTILGLDHADRDRDRYMNSPNLDLPDPDIGIDISSWERNKERLLIPLNEASKLKVSRACHDSGIAGHWGRHRTQELVSRNFWWDNAADGLSWQEDIAAYVASCQRCQLAKAGRHSKVKKLLLMPTGVRPWEEFAMDFVGELPASDGWNAILVITDRFTKMPRHIPAKTT